MSVKVFRSEILTAQYTQPVSRHAGLPAQTTAFVNSTANFIRGIDPYHLVTCDTASVGDTRHHRILLGL